MKNKTLKIFAAITVTIILTMAVFAVQTATRIRFAKGKSSATMTGTVGDSGMKDYIIRGNKGQELSATVTSSCESVQIIVIDNGTGQVISENPSTEYTEELPGTDDYIIRVQNSDSASCKFSLKVGIK
ncbi:MAG TPA: hypothetical protein PKY82_03810 [Pyrinomonadaceae bacterium]|nr:hypothetical protein [Pyrinomonadaceae bacterium]